jgi:hypothetical protein
MRRVPSPFRRSFCHRARLLCATPTRPPLFHAVMFLFWCIVSFLLLFCFRSTVLPFVCPTHLISVVSDPPLFSVLIYGNMHSYSNSLYLFMFWPYFASESYRFLESHLFSFVLIWVFFPG